MSKPRMQRAHFQLIAATVKGMVFQPKHKQFIAESFADNLRGTNPKFDRDRFILACGVEP